jgi:hypothetical protein
MSVRYISSPSGTYSVGIGDDAAAPAQEMSLHDKLNSDPVTTAAAAAMAYHGYKRTGSLTWALVYALAGKWFPIEAVPIALAQGFGQKKECK